MPNTPSWLTARPVAHRGLHDSAQGLIENTLPAFEAAIARGFAIELDVQVTADADAVVFHDERLERLTDQDGMVKSLDREALQSIPITGGGTHIPSLAQVLSQIDGRTPLIVELKSVFDGDVTLARAVAGAVAAYRGPIALMSFDPAMLRELKQNAVTCPLGMVFAPSSYAHWGPISALTRFRLGHLLHDPGWWCDFVSYEQSSLPAIAPLLAKWVGRKALLCWTIKTPEAAKRVDPYVDAITFEGFDPLGATT